MSNRVHLINPSHVSFGVGVITPRWLYVLAISTPTSFGDPVICDETLEPPELTTIKPGDSVGIRIHTEMRCADTKSGVRPRRTRP